MQLNFRSYQKIQTKSILKQNNFLLFALGANQNSSNWIALEQSLHKLNLTYIKTYNNITIKVFQTSAAKNLKNTINSTFFFLKPKKKLKNTVTIKSNFLNEIKTSNLNIISLKLNKKAYAISQLKTINSFHYKKDVSVMYQFLSTTLKTSLRLKQKK